MRRKNTMVRLKMNNGFRFLQIEDKSDHRHGLVLKREDNF